MSNDQASKLRSLVQRQARSANGSPVAAPRTIVVSAARPLMGGTTLATHLAVGLAENGQRTILVDTDLREACATLRCGMKTSPGLADVLAGRRSVHEVLQLGPAGMQLIAGAQAFSQQPLWSERTAERLVKQMAALGRHMDVLVFDAACPDPQDQISAGKETLLPLWQHADDVVLVTLSDDAAVMETYALLKTLWARNITVPRLHLVVSRGDAATAADVHARLDRSAQRFLGLGVEHAGHLPIDEESQHLSGSHTAAFAAAVERVTEHLLTAPSRPLVSLRPVA